MKRWPQSEFVDFQTSEDARRLYDVPCSAPGSLMLGLARWLSTLIILLLWLLCRFTLIGRLLRTCNFEVGASSFFFPSTRTILSSISPYDKNQRFLAFASLKRVCSFLFPSILGPSSLYYYPVINIPWVLYETHPVRLIIRQVHISIRCPPNTKLPLRRHYLFVECQTNTSRLEKYWTS